MELAKLNFEKIFDWFHIYANSFEITDSDHSEAHEIKITHSYRVKDIMQHLAAQLHWNEYDINLAALIGLLHDVARFPQYARYKTFHDLKSVDHGDYAFEILEKEQILNSLPIHIQKTILSAVKWHNKQQILEDLTEYEMKFARLIRDADKLDIFFLVCPVYEENSPDLAHKIKLTWPHEPKISDFILDSFLNEKTVDFSKICFINDFKIAQLAWIYDLNFKPSVEWMIERKYIEKIIYSLPDETSQQLIFKKLKKFLYSKWNLQFKED